MTHEDQVAVIGRLVQTYSQARRKRAVLVAECARIARVLDEEARRLRSLDMRDPAVTIDFMVPAFPERDALMSLLKELGDVSRVAAESKALINQAGLKVD
jgi:hypothetical protein